jgi:muconolactone delta-isomerase
VLFAVRMDVSLPPDLDPGLPLFPYMKIQVTPLGQHPSDIALS